MDVEKKKSRYIIILHYMKFIVLLHDFSIEICPDNRISETRFIIHIVGLEKTEVNSVFAESIAEEFSLSLSLSPCSLSSGSLLFFSTNICAEKGSASRRISQKILINVIEAANDISRSLVTR